MAMKKLHVAMDDILDAMTSSQDDPVQFFLDLAEGKVVLVVDDYVSGESGGDELQRAIADDPDRYAEIPRTETREEHDLMGRFAGSVDEEDIRERLDLALRGKGAFARFRDVVFRYPDLKTRWFAMRQEALLSAAKTWLSGLGIEPVYQLLAIEEPPPADPSRSSGHPSISLMDVLLLGASKGKTELIEGRVHRQAVMGSPSEARGLFKSLARELCAYYGLEWRNRHIENKTTFDIERTHLRLDGTQVKLSIDVPASIWQAFA